MSSQSVSTLSPTAAAAKAKPQAAEADQSALRSGIVLLGRTLFAFIFLLAGVFHFSAPEIAYAAHQGLPFAGFLVPASGLLAAAGGLSILLGYRAKIGAWLLVLFLVPVTLTMHNFWAVKDPMMAQMQMVMFMKNASILGGALVISQLGAGPLSLDARRNRRR
jgi:putative oxidoreductase